MIDHLKLYRQIQSRTATPTTSIVAEDAAKLDAKVSRATKRTAQARAVSRLVNSDPNVDDKAVYAADRALAVALDHEAQVRLEYMRTQIDEQTQAIREAYYG